MKTDIEVLVSAAGGLAVRTAEGTFPVLTVGEGAQRLRRSRRQIYRLMKAGTLGLRAKVLGECLLDEADVKQASAVAEFVARRGASLAPRSRAFWEAYFGVRAAPGPVWRRQAPWRR